MTVLDDCYNETTDNNLTSYVIDDLDAYTIYNVSVAAHTVIGQGDFFDIVNDTLMGGKSDTNTYIYYILWCFQGLFN